MTDKTEAERVALNLDETCSLARATGPHDRPDGSCPGCKAIEAYGGAQRQAGRDEENVRVAWVVAAMLKRLGGEFTITEAEARNSEGVIVIKEHPSIHEAFNVAGSVTFSLRAPGESESGT
jgi:hypothetical protein